MKIIKPLPSKCKIACSGGVDSVFALHFLTRVKNREVSLIHINHGTPMANTYEYFVRTLSKIYSIKCDFYRISGKTENDWREERYKIFTSYKETVITCHHQDDNLETMVMRNKPIPYQRDNILRPFLLVSKKEIVDYCLNHNLSWVEDPTNTDADYCERNRIRKAILNLRKHEEFLVTMT